MLERDLGGNAEWTVFVAGCRELDIEYVLIFCIGVYMTSNDLGTYMKLVLLPD